MLSGTSLDLAKESAERIRKQVRAEQFESGPVTISIGVAEYPSHGDTAKSVIGQADAALYEAKRAGRDRVVCAVAKSSKKKEKAGIS
jgi:diguanylate cyclase (GGDEF)-like protein